MAVVIFADAHVQDRAWVKRPMVGDSFWALFQVVSYAIDVGASAVIGAGDLLDQQRNRSAPVTFWYRQLSRLQAASIPFFYLEGQHDLDSPAWLSGHHHAKPLHRRLVSIDGHSFYGINFCQPDVLKRELASVPSRADVLVCHQAWSEWLGHAGHASFQDVPKSVKWLFTGDFHACRIENFGSLTVCSPGSLAMQSLSEPPSKFFFVFDKGHVHKRRIRSRPFGRLRFKDLSSTVKRLKDVVSRMSKCASILPEQVRVPLVVVENVPGPEEESVLLSAVDGMAYVVCRRSVKSELPEIKIESQPTSGPDWFSSLPKESSEFARALWECVESGRDAKDLVERWVRGWLHVDNGD